MTWLKTSDDFPDDCARAGLTDAAYRTHHEGLSWVMRRETGGFLDSVDIRRACESRELEAAIAELLACGFWERYGSGFRIVHGMEHQPDVDVLVARREKNAARQARFRRRKLGLPTEESNAVTGRVTAPKDPESNGVTRRVTRDGSGRVGKNSPLDQNPALERGRRGEPKNSPLLPVAACPNCRNALVDCDCPPLASGGAR